MEQIYKECIKVRCMRPHLPYSNRSSALHSSLNKNALKTVAKSQGDPRLQLRMEPVGCCLVTDTSDLTWECIILCISSSHDEP